MLVSLKPASCDLLKPCKLFFSCSLNFHSWIFDSCNFISLRLDWNLWSSKCHVPIYPTTWYFFIVERKLSIFKMMWKPPSKSFKFIFENSAILSESPQGFCSFFSFCLFDCFFLSSKFYFHHMSDVVYCTAFVYVWFVWVLQLGKSSSKSFITEKYNSTFIISFTYFIQKLYLKAHSMFACTTSLQPSLLKLTLWVTWKVKFQILRQHNLSLHAYEQQFLCRVTVASVTEQHCFRIGSFFTFHCGVSVNFLRNPCSPYEEEVGRA